MIILLGIILLVLLAVAAVAVIVNLAPFILGAMTLILFITWCQPTRHRRG